MFVERRRRGEIEDWGLEVLVFVERNVVCDAVLKIGELVATRDVFRFEHVKVRASPAPI